jgi:hypothetical protein
VTAWGSEAETLESAVGSFQGPVEIARPGARFDI